MTNLNLRQLEAFVSVVETGSFTDAAGKLFLSQSTVSSHVQNLEQNLNVELFRRDDKRNLELTKAGKQIYHSAKRVLNECLELESKARLDDANELILGASTVPSQRLVPSLLSTFAAKHEECRFNLMFDDSTNVLQMVLDGEVQVGLVGSHHKRSDLEFEPIGHDKLVMITPVNDRFKKLQAEGTLGADLLNEPLLVRELNSGTQKRILEYLKNKGLEQKDLNIKGQISMSDTLVELVKQGVGVALISNLLVEKEVEAGNVLLFELEKQPVSREIYLVRRTKTPHSELAQAFWEHCLASR